jgi:hypothetical protein
MKPVSTALDCLLSFCRIDLVHIPDIILKWCVFIHVISLMTGKGVPVISRAMEKTMN